MERGGVEGPTGCLGPAMRKEAERGVFVTGACGVVMLQMRGTLAADWS